MALDSPATTTPTPLPEPPKTPPQKYGMLLFPAFELLDVFGPLETLQRLTSYHKVDLILLSETLDTVTTKPGSSNMNAHNSTGFPGIVPTHTLDNAPEMDVLFVPGGLGTRSPNMNRTIDFIAETYPKVKYLITICTGSRLAAQSGVLDGKRATTNKASWNSTVALGPKVDWQPRARWTVDGNVWTSSGISAGVDATFAFLDWAYGEETATTIANLMEYERHTDPDWDPFADTFEVPGR
ncbi:DJ-1/PfpI family protein [Aspergillus steynii IBT 23096]|uniref:DJ-1/PfpI family protein n=1 Tax=Aspergillus steynii IBT 23096 TaxID=1392250 RepID=A0A2I2G3I6_9EURO|nr:DJ-1/PfpI family protein [Aspergillus steynii IBT 23096]PLB47441.1 DJ-1/PfpI family protein [Aspergillus steynii IBT 23096]